MSASSNELKKKETPLPEIAGSVVLKETSKMHWGTVTVLQHDANKVPGQTVVHAKQSNRLSSAQFRDYKKKVVSSETGLRMCGNGKN